MQTMEDLIGEVHYEWGLEKGREEGLERGREEGLERGREEGLEQAARALMAAQGLTPEAALDLLGVDGSLRERVLARLLAQ